MNAENLLKHYDKIAEAPKAIDRLRSFILDLAVRGKLVSQDDADEPASELLKRIAIEKAQLVKAGKIRKFVEPNFVVPEDQPFEIPKKWEWVQLGDLLTKLTDGTHHSPPNADSGDFKYITAKNIKKNGVLLDNVTYVSREIHDEIFARCNPARGDILYIKDGATTGVVTVNDLDEPFSMLSSVALLKLPSCLFNQLVVQFLRSPFFYDQMRGFMKGAAITRVTLKRMGPALFPLPPLAEQHRIVAKVDELMGLCDRLESARAARESVRDQLASASLTRLSAPDPETFWADARFALDALPALITRSDQIKALRQTILSLGVCGKLVLQDPDEEPASKLLKRILALPWTKKRRSSDIEPNDDALAEAFPLPRGWEWASVEALVRPNETVTYGILKPEWVADGVPTVRVTEMKTGTIDVASLPKCDRARAAKFQKTTLAPGDLLISKDGTIGRTAFVPPELAGGNITQHMLRYPICDLVNTRYVRLAIDSPFCQSWMAGETKGVALQGVNVGDFRRMPIPLPPLTEQHRIVVKVDALMALCDRLEASLSSSAATRSRLLDALLAEALIPADNRASEAA